MIRAIDRFYAKHPRIALAIAILIAFACMYASSMWDRADDAGVRLQINTRSMT